MDIEVNYFPNLKEPICMIEIEFSTEYDAIAFNPDNYFDYIAEVTDDKNYKVKNMWKQMLEDNGLPFINGINPTRHYGIIP